MKFTSFKAGFWMLSVVLFIGFSPAALAKVEVKLVEPQKFHDYELSNYSKKASRKMLKKHFTRLFESVSQGIIQDSDTLSIEVTQLDLAGYMEYFYGNLQRNIRIVKNNTRYRVKFNYKLTNAAGDVLKEGVGDIKDFLDHRPVRSQLKHRDYQVVGYMHDTILEWMEETFTSQE